MTDRKETESALRAWLDAVNSHDLDAYPKTVTPDYTWTFGAASTTGADASREAWRAFFLAFPDYKITLHETIVEPPRVAWRATMTGTHEGPFAFRGFRAADHPFAPTSRKFKLDCVGWFEVRDGRVAVNRAYWDPSDLLGQLGLR